MGNRNSNTDTIIVHAPFIEYIKIEDDIFDVTYRFPNCKSYNKIMCYSDIYLLSKKIKVDPIEKQPYDGNIR